MTTRLICDVPEDFQRFLAQVESMGTKNVYLLFYAAENPATGISWCPDCVRAKPLINEVFDKITEDTVLLIATVERDDYRTKKDYLYRAPPITLRCVPTLIRWHNGAKVYELNDVQCQNIDLIEEMVNFDPDAKK
jgi:thiol-disulfide isomerase/thioredoxin